MYKASCRVSYCSLCFSDTFGSSTKRSAFLKLSFLLVALSSSLLSLCDRLWVRLLVTFYESIHTHIRVLHWPHGGEGAEGTIRGRGKLKIGGGELPKGRGGKWREIYCILEGCDVNDARFLRRL